MMVKRKEQPRRALALKDGPEHARSRDPDSGKKRRRSATPLRPPSKPKKVSSSPAPTPKRRRFKEVVSRSDVDVDSDGNGQDEEG